MNYHLVLCRNATLNKVKSVVRGRRGIDFSNHPKSTVLFKFFALSYFAGKKSHV